MMVIFKSSTSNINNKDIMNNNNDMAKMKRMMVMMVTTMMMIMMMAATPEFMLLLSHEGFSQKLSIIKCAQNSELVLPTPSVASSATFPQQGAAMTWRLKEAYDGPLSRVVSV